jgi:hypothetical protein
LQNKYNFFSVQIDVITPKIGVFRCILLKKYKIFTPKVGVEVGVGVGVSNTPK